MKYQKSISILTIFIIALSLVAGIIGIMSMGGGSDGNTFLSLYGENVQLYGNGIYKNDSFTAASQAIAQDWVTVLLGIPLLSISYYFARKNSLRAKILFTGTMTYFLYTYMSYSFLCMYNALFLVYVTLMSMCFFALVLSIMSFDLAELKRAFANDIPVKYIGTFMIVFAVALMFMWLGRIVPPLLNGEPPQLLEHYTTFVIQVMDLGLIIPVTIVAAVLLLKRKPEGLLLTSIMCMKGATMTTALTAMTITQKLLGIEMSIGEFLFFPIINVIVVLFVIILLRTIKEN